MLLYFPAPVAVAETTTERETGRWPPADGMLWGSCGWGWGREGRGHPWAMVEEAVRAKGEVCAKGWWD